MENPLGKIYSEIHEFNSSAIGRGIFNCNFSRALLQMYSVTRLELCFTEAFCLSWPEDVHSLWLVWSISYTPLGWLPSPFLLQGVLQLSPLSDLEGTLLLVVFSCSEGKLCNQNPSVFWELPQAYWLCTPTTVVFNDVVLIEMGSDSHRSKLLSLTTVTCMAQLASIQCSRAICSTWNSHDPGFRAVDPGSRVVVVILHVV